MDKGTGTLANGCKSGNFTRKLSTKGEEWETTTTFLAGATRFFRDFSKPVRTELSFIWPTLNLPSFWYDKLEAPFPMPEFWEAVFGSYANDAAGSDGLPMHFYQKNWDSVAGDLLKVLNEFHAGGKLVSINYSWIILKPKVEGAASIRDVRPISLANCVYKIIFKVLANRLKGVMGEMVGAS